MLHLGDFVYEVVDYPEDEPGGKRYDRRLRDAVRLPDGEKVLTRFHVAASLRDYRTLYRAYLRDPDLQDARARWPFVPIWDNHEFSWMGWQSFQRFGTEVRVAQTRRVAASQAWFEYQPARVRKAGGAALERFEAPAVKDAPITTFDDNGIGQEPNNLLAIESLSPQRSLRFGQHLDLVLTDHCTHRSEEPTSRAAAAPLSVPEFPELYAEEAVQVLDAGRAYGGGKPPQTIAFGDAKVPNFRKDEAPQTLLGPAQKAWFVERLRTSTATWKVWGTSLGTLDWRADPQNLPAGLTKPWPGAGYACFGGGGDWGSAYTERGEIYDAVRAPGITGFVTVSGDRHSFWAGLSSKALPPGRFEPVGVAFITGSVSAPGLVEAYEHRFPKDHPLRALYMPEVNGQAAARHQPAAAPRRARVSRVPAHRRPRARASPPPTPTSRRTFRSWTWAATATRRCARRRTRWSASSSASRGRSSAARPPTAGRCATACRTARRCGARASAAAGAAPRGRGPGAVRLDLLGQDLLQAVVAGGHAGLHAGLEDAVPCLL